MRELFGKYKNLSIAVFGDYCLDEYLWIDAALNEPSLETGLVAYQCVKRESFTGAAGTIAKNLANLGVGTVYAVGCVGDDGRGMELLRGLDFLGINRDYMITAKNRVTPAYTKPWLIENGQTRELSRIDIKNWTETPTELEDTALDQLKGLIGKLDALIVLDQMTEPNCGIITDRVRNELEIIAQQNPGLIVYADSRMRIGKFHEMIIKGNQHEITRAVFGEESDDPAEIRRSCEVLREKNHKPVIVTLGEKGAWIDGSENIIEIPGVVLSGQLDVCGAGDMFTAAFITALAAGANMENAGKIGNIAAAICVTQLGTSGYVKQDDLLEMLEKSC